MENLVIPGRIIEMYIFLKEINLRNQVSLFWLDIGLNNHIPSITYYSIKVPL